MQNYWLSEFEEKSGPDMVDPEDDTDTDTDTDNGDSEDPAANDVKGNLTDRQQEMYEDYEEIVDKFGMFKQDSKADGAHYASANANPFKEEGLICSNCVFYIGGGACEIVKGKIEPEAICKLWIIPQELIKVSKKK